MASKVRKGPPPIVYLVTILLLGYAGYHFLSSSGNNSSKNEEKQKQDNITETPQPKLEAEYQQLETSLRNEEWRKADWLTWNLLETLVDTNNSGWLNEKEIKKLSCSHLLKIDQLWRGYSREKFGFSVQKKIYENIGGAYNSSFNIGAYRSFSYQVGWINPESEKMRGGYYFHKHLTFNLDNTPRGHLPAFSSTWISYHSPKGGFVAIAEKLNSCQN